MRRTIVAALVTAITAMLPTSPALAAAVRPGATYHGDATYYPANEALGNCSYGQVPYIRIAALNSTDYDNARMCGAYVRVTGPRGTETVKIIDRCPECESGEIDLNGTVFGRIADPLAGRVRVSWRLVSPDTTNKLSFRYKEGSSTFWCALQVRNHRNPVVKLEVSVSGTWRALPRTEYNYFISNNGQGCGSSIRVTDIHGQRLTVSGIRMQPGALQETSVQFGKH